MTQLTPTIQDMKEEIIRCERDCDYFLHQYVKIMHPLHGTVPFRTYPFQKDVLQELLTHRFNIILKARQLGLTTLIASLCSWELLFRRDRNIMIMATELGTAVNMLVKVKKIFKSVPDWLRTSEIVIDNERKLKLSNGSVITASAATRRACCSESLTMLVIDEAAFIDEIEEIWTAAKPILSTEGSCIALSTSNGSGDWFEKTYSEALAGINGFNAITLPWHVHPERDEEWFKEETRDLDSLRIAQEYLCSFGDSRDIIVHPEIIQELEKAPKDPFEKHVDSQKGSKFI